MSRSGYSDGIEEWSLIRWRGQVASAIRGKRGQKLLVDLYKALDAMPNKRLIADELEAGDGEVCALGALGKARGLDMKGVDPGDADVVAAMFGCAHQLAKEIVYENDEAFYYLDETPEHRYARIKQWVLEQILPVPVSDQPDAVEAVS
jgi:hypothetical protein